MFLLNRFVSPPQRELEQAQARLEQYRATLRLAGVEIERRNRGIRALTTFAYKANWLTEPAALLKLALVQALEITESQMGALVLIDQETKQFYLGAHQGLSPDMVRILTGRQYDEGAALLMPHLANGKGVLLEWDKQVEPAERMLLQAAQAHSLISLPLHASQLLGSLIVGARNDFVFSPANLNFLIALSQQTAVAFDSLRVREKLWHFAESLLSQAAEQEPGTMALTMPTALPPVSPLQARLASLVADLGGAMAAIFVLSPAKGDTRISLAADYGLSPLFTTTFSDSLRSAALFPDELLLAPSWVQSTLTKEATKTAATPLLTSLREEGARSVVAIRMEQSGASARLILIAAAEAETFTTDHAARLAEQARELAPLIMEPSSVPTLPTHNIHIPALSHHPSTDDLEKLLAAMMDAEEESYRHNADLLALNGIAETLNRTLNLGAILGSVIGQTRAMLQSEAAWLYLLESPDSTELRLKAQEGLSERYAHGMRRLKVGDGFEGWVARENKAQFVNDVADHPLRCQLLVQEEKVQAIAAVPLTCLVEYDGREESRTVGVIAVARRQVYSWQPREIRLLTAVAHQMALAVNNALLHAQVQDGLERLAASNEVLKRLNRQLLEQQLVLRVPARAVVAK
jgi:GAF domain-containing protein